MTNIIVIWASSTHGIERRYAPTINSLFAKKFQYNEVYIHKPFKADRSLTVLGKKVAESLTEINGVESIEFRPQEFTVRLRDGFKWEEVHPAIIKALTSALGWDEYELLDGSKWIEERSKENEEFTRQLRGEEVPDDSEKTYVSPEKISAVIEQKETGIITLTFMPPKAISEDELSFTRPLSRIDKRRISKLDEQRKILVEKILSVEGVIGINLWGVYLINVPTSPAFYTVKIRDEILKIIKEVYLS